MIDPNLPRTPNEDELYQTIKRIVQQRLDELGIAMPFKTVLDAAYAGGDPKTLDPGETTAAAETHRILSAYSDCLPEPGEDVIKMMTAGGPVILGAVRALPAGKRRDGAYMLLPEQSVENAPTATAWATVNQIRGIKLYFPNPFTVAAVHFQVVGPTAGCLAAAGLYSSDRTTKIIDSGAIDCSTAGVKTGTSVVGWIPKGWYWFVFTCNDNTTTFRTMVDSHTDLTNLTNQGTVQRASFGNSTGAALPSLLTTPTGASFATFPIVKIQG